MLNTPAARMTLLRHGVTQNTPAGVLRGRLDDPLSTTGWQQMHSALARLEAAIAAEKQPGYQRIISSPLRRCSEFAAELATSWSVPLTLDERLTELDFGSWEGCAVDDLLQQPASAAALQNFWDDPWTQPPPQGETLAAFEHRVLTAWNEWVHHDATTHTLVVTHAGVMRLLLCAQRQLPRNALLGLDIPHAHLQTLPCLALSKLRRSLEQSI